MWERKYGFLIWTLGEYEPTGHDNSYLQLVSDSGHNEFSPTGNYTVILMKLDHYLTRLMDIIMNERESRNIKKLTKMQLWTAEIQIEIHHLSDRHLLPGIIQILWPKDISFSKIVENIDLFSVIKPKSTLLTDLICIATIAGIWQENWGDETSLQSIVQW